MLPTRILTLQSTYLDSTLCLNSLPTHPTPIHIQHIFVSLLTLSKPLVQCVSDKSILKHRAAGASTARANSETSSWRTTSPVHTATRSSHFRCIPEGSRPSWGGVCCILSSTHLPLPKLLTPPFTPIPSLPLCVQIAKRSVHTDETDIQTRWNTPAGRRESVCVSCSVRALSFLSFFSMFRTSLCFPNFCFLSVSSSSYAFFLSNSVSLLVLVIN